MSISMVQVLCMTLPEYLDAQERRHGALAELARRADLSYGTVWKLANRPNYRLTVYAQAKRLSDATGGLVTIEELCERPAAEHTEAK